MKAVHLNLVIHDHKRGERCGEMEPNVFEDALLMDGGKPVGFYIASVSKRSEKLSALLALANAEFRSDRVPKSLLERTDVLQASSCKGTTRKKARANGTIQQSTIIGSVPPSPLKRRYTPRASNVHGAASAQTFIKSMLMAADIADTIIQEVMPEAHARQLRNIQAVPKGLRFGRIWTSSISNYNVSAPYHTDRSNLPESLNVIFAKRAGSVGGNLVVPDYGAVFEQPDDSMLVYPAWRNLHGVTPIKPLFPGGYRNSLILYALNLAEKPDA